MLDRSTNIYLKLAFMKIDVIDKFETFQELRKNWDFVYDFDPQAQFFLSWNWMSGWLKLLKEPWLILAAKPNPHASDYVAIFPLKITVQQDGGQLYNEIFMAGNSSADYTGLICLPEYEEDVIPAFAAYIKQELTWAVFNLQDILETDTRMHLLLRSFSEDNFEFSQQGIQNQQPDNIDNDICPYIPLADDWEHYLQNALSSNTRQKIKRLLRKIEGSKEFHITHVNADNLEQHIEILLKFWQAKWGRRKGDACEAIIECLRAILHYCFENNCLYFPVLWKGDKPIGAIANLIDVSKKSILFYVTGRDETVKDPPPGLILHAYGIQYAIQNKFKVYDFLRGNEAYKYSFGVKERRIQHIVVKRTSISQNRKLDVKTLPKALQLTAVHHRANRLAEAEQGYCQILEVQPSHPDALYGLGVVMKQKGEYQSAENLLRSLLQTQPKSTRVWFVLANLHQTQGQLSEAVEAYRQVLALQPTPAVYNNLGYTLQQQCKWDDAIACYQKALELQPDCIEADVNLANALHTQGKLSPEKQADYAALNNDLGTRCKQASDWENALVHYRQAISMKPDLTDAHYNLGLVLQELGEFEAAIASYQKALELKPDFEQAYFQLDKLHHSTLA